MKNYYLTEVNRIEEQHYEEVVEGVTWGDYKEEMWKELIVVSIWGVLQNEL